MKKPTYRTKNVNKINWSLVKEQLSGVAVVFALDVAKTKQFALLTNADASVSEGLWWNHPEQTPELLNSLEGLGYPVDVVMESTSTYGDALRYQFRHSGFGVYQVKAKRVYDAQEIYDGVPSMHDAKSAMVITRLHREKLTQPWVELTNEERQLDAMRREYDLHQSQYQRNQNRLEAYLSRHWPEVDKLLALHLVTLESLLVEYGSSAQIAIDTCAATKNMRAWGRCMLSDEKIADVIKSACQTLGQPCIAAEQQYLQALAKEMRHDRLHLK